MVRKRIKFSNNLVYLAIGVIVILMLVLGRKGGGDIEILEENLGLEESTGSGFLDIKTLPDGAEIFLDDNYKGLSPLTIYNIPAGVHKVVIKKEGYDDFIREAGIEAGKKTLLETSLVLTKVEEYAEVIEIAEEEKEEDLTVPEASNIINLGNKISLYYDFSKREFVSNRQPDSDTFSRRYKEYLIFTRFMPTSIKTIDKNIDDVGKEDCAGITGQFEFLKSEQSLCFITKENQIGALGGTWDNTENAELTWKLFN